MSSGVEHAVVAEDGGEGRRIWETRERIVETFCRDRSIGYDNRVSVFYNEARYDRTYSIRANSFDKSSD